MATTSGNNVLKTTSIFAIFVLLILTKKTTCIEEDIDKSMLSFDTKHDGETLCDPNAFRKTFPAADLLGHCVNMLRPGAPIGDRCFEVNRTMSADCLFWNPKGFNVQRERVGRSDIQHTVASSLLELSHSRQFGVSASVGVKTASFGASVSTEYENRKKDSSSRSEKMEYMLAFMEQIDHQAEMSLAFPPEVTEHLVHIVKKLESVKRRLRRQLNGTANKEEVDRLVDEAEEEVFRVVSRAGTHILLKSVFGSRTSEVSFFPSQHSSKSSPVLFFVFVFDGCRGMFQQKIVLSFLTQFLQRNLLTLQQKQSFCNCVHIFWSFFKKLTRGKCFVDKSALCSACFSETNQNNSCMWKFSLFERTKGQLIGFFCDKFAF